LKAPSFKPLYDYTADAALELHAPDLKGLICLLTEALVSQLVERPPKSEEIELTVEVESAGLPYLFADFANELLYLFEVKKFLPKSCKVLDLSPNGSKLRVLLKGERYGRSRHGFGTLIKAATYHDLELKEEKGGYRLRIVFDL